MSRLRLFAVFTLIAWACTSRPIFAQSLRTTTVSVRPYPGPMLIVPVEINSRGPYDFVLDTGSTVTILDGPLFRELGLKPEGNAELTGPAKSNRARRGICPLLKERRPLRIGISIAMSLMGLPCRDLRIHGSIPAFP